MKIGSYLVTARKKRGLSQEDVAQSLEVSRQSVSLWECDQTIPSLDNLISLSNLYNVSISILTGQEDFKDDTNISSGELKNDNGNSKSKKVFSILSIMFLILSTIFVLVPIVSSILAIPALAFAILSFCKNKNNKSLLILIFAGSIFLAHIFGYTILGNSDYLVQKLFNIF